MTEAQATANQRNAQHSTGPRTEEGKARARYNAHKPSSIHSLTYPHNVQCT